METPVDRAVRAWLAFCGQMDAKIKEAAQSGIAPNVPDNALLRRTLTALTPEQFSAFLADSRLDEPHRDPGKDALEMTRFAVLLCFLPPRAALPLAKAYSDPCRARTNLPARPRVLLFLTFRWKTFLTENLRRQGAILTLSAYRFQIKHFVERFGDEKAKALLTPDDPPALAQELVQVQKQLEKQQAKRAKQAAKQGT